MLEKALKLNPKNENNLYLLGTLYHASKNYVEAEKYMKQGIEIMDAPLDKQYMYLARALNRQKKYKEAIEILKKAIRENPKNHQPYFFLTRTKIAYYEDYDSKISACEDYLKRFPKSFGKQEIEFELKKLKQEQFMKGETKD